MFRLKEQQLHMLIWLIAAASVLLFVIFGLEKLPKIDQEGSWNGLNNFSEGWICTYETMDLEKLRAYKKTKDTDEKKEGEGNNTIVEVVSVPATFSVKENTGITMLHQVPEMNLSTVYLTLELDNASVVASIGENVIYESNEKEKGVPVRHVIPIVSNYQGKTVMIQIMGNADEMVKVGTICAGNYNQLWVSTLAEQGLSIGIGLILLCISLCMLVVWKVIKNNWHQKRLLLYSSLEGMFLSLLCILDGEIISLITGWNYGVYILRTCAIIIAIILHLAMIRCFIYKKKVIALVDTGILLCSIFFISAMVLQAFSLVQFDSVYLVGMILYGVFVLIFTIVLAIAIVEYKRQEGIPVFVANILLIVSIIIHLVLAFLDKVNVSELLCIHIGFAIYMLYIWINGLRQSLTLPKKKDEDVLDEMQIRRQVVEQLNPNLLFASFQTLQQLIKQGSSKSVNMIYYISVYLRHNLKMLEAEEEMIPFEEELEHMMAYLQLQKTRNRNLDFAIECKVKEFKVPRHSLEPLVENAVKHGIAKNDNHGNVVVRTYTRADGYAIQIIDDGAGFDTSILKKKSSTLKKKLMKLECDCQAKTEVISKDGKGTVVTVVLPMLENEQMEELDEMDITEG